MTYADPAGPSQVPAYALVGLLVAAVALVGIAGWLWVHSRHAADRVSRAVVCAMVGLAVTFGWLVVAGNRHYGGTTSGFRQGTSGSRYTCDQWYQEAGLPSSRGGVAGDSSASCRHDAIAAIGPAIGWGVLAGAVAAVALFGLLWTLRRAGASRAARSASTTRYIDTDAS
jgi:hypothetical protein